MLHILLAEDNRGDALLIEQALLEHHVTHKLHVVTDGEKALEFFTQMGNPGQPPCPDLLLLDLNLPKVDGPQLLSEFRKHPQCQNTPVIVVTSSDAPKDRAYASALGVSHYFKKPSNLDDYLKIGAVVRDIVGNKSA